jgi:hypothetical protein
VDALPKPIVCVLRTERRQLAGKGRITEDKSKEPTHLSGSRLFLIDEGKSLLVKLSEKLIP